MDDLKISKLINFDSIFCKNLDYNFRSEFLLYRLRHLNDTRPWSITSLMVGWFVDRRSVRSARFVCGRHHAACQINWCIHNSTAHGEHLAATLTRARCRKQTGGEGWGAGVQLVTGQPTSLIFASYRRSFDVYSSRVCTACTRWPRC